ncbi:MAG: hypothetical protein HZC41_02995 [Chloroflexi bacterium]|nr:hypothetical protein [Chloroflexota bacterium]
MPEKDALQRLGDEIFNLIERYDIAAEMYSMNIRISREEYDRLKHDLAGSNLGTTIALAGDRWSIQLLFPFLTLKPSDEQE